MRCKVLEMGCGKGYLAGYLKAEGFHNVNGVDCSNNLIEIAREKKQYSNLERMVVGQPDYEIDDSYKEQFDFVVVPSMINNNGYDKKVFIDMLKPLKIGGFAVFATKLDQLKQDIYSDIIK
jgi:2-polyprenyl-3-methyl-5-hydroxy-6-metoxy-1,4-benzoquinol methylase